MAKGRTGQSAAREKGGTVKSSRKRRPCPQHHHSIRRKGSLLGAREMPWLKVSDLPQRSL